MSLASAALRDSLKEAQDSLKKALVASGKCQGLEDEVMTLKVRLSACLLDMK